MKCRNKTMLKLLLPGLLFFVSLAHGQESVFDQELANSFGADEYGMKSYSFVILKKGSVVLEDEEKRQKIMRGHLDNIGKLAEEGKLIVAGPFGKNDLNYRGLFILTTQSTEEALDILDTDPAIAAGVFDIDVLPWYGAAALSAYLEVQENITKTKP